MFEAIRRWLEGTDRRIDDMVSDALHDPVVTYNLPGAPPTGSKVRESEGRVFKRLPAEAVDVVSPWGFWEDQETGEKWAWYALLAEYGTLTLVREHKTPEQIRDEELYGPEGARWGDPALPCPYRMTCHLEYNHPGRHDAVFTAAYRPKSLLECRWEVRCDLGTNHVGPHLDRQGNDMAPIQATVMPGTIAARVTREDLDTPCTCGRPAHHLAYCARYARMSGSDED